MGTSCGLRVRGAAPCPAGLRTGNGIDEKRRTAGGAAVPMQTCRGRGCMRIVCVWGSCVYGGRGCV